MKHINVTPFDNGITLYSMASRLMNVSAIGFRNGSIHDPPGQSGMNHLVEHMMCVRSVKHTSRDVDRIMNRYLGGSHGEEMNVRCDRSNVLFGHDDLRRREHMWTCFDMFASMVKDAIMDVNGLGPRILTHKSLKIEKGAIHNEYRLRGTDVVEGHIYDLVHWHMYRINPARRRVDCALSDLGKIELGDVRNFIRNRYTAGNMFVIMIGPNNNEAVDKVREYFGDLSQGELAPLNYDHSEDMPVLDGVKSFELIRPGIEQNHIAIAFPVGGYLSKDVEALDVLASIWEYRIEKRLREGNLKFKGGIYHPEAYFPRTFTHGLIAAWFATVGNNEYTERAINIALEECDKLKTDESTELAEDCEDKCEFLGSAYDQKFLWYPRYLCEDITEATSNGDINLKHFLSYRKRLAKVTPQRIREVANKYLTNPNKYLRVVVKPLVVPREVIDRASDEVKPYLEAINHDPDFGGV